MNTGANKSWLKEAARFLVHRAGPLDAVRQWNRSGVCILLYHHFPPADAATFERQCALLRKRFSPVSMADVAAWLHQGKPLPPHAVAITVDDGYRNFYTVAYPILQRYGMTATMYLATDFLDGKDWLWVDKLRCAFAGGRSGEVDLGWAGTPERVRLYDVRSRSKAFEQVKQAAKQMKNRERKRMMAELPERLGWSEPGGPPDELGPLAWDEVREMARHGMEFGAHTQTHPILSSLDSEAEIENEIEGSRRRIEQELDRDVPHFTYPNGLEWDIPAGGPAIVKRLRFRTAARADGGLNFRGVDPFLLYRRTMDVVSPLDRLERTVAGWPV